MEKNSEDFSVKEAQRLAQTPSGQQLYTALQNADDPVLRAAMEALNAGELKQAQKLLSQSLASGQLKEILRLLR